VIIKQQAENHQVIERKMTTKSTDQSPLRAKLIFNGLSGRPEDSPRQLFEILNEMQSLNILPEVFMIREDSRVEDVVRDALQGGINLIVVAGGDGTIDSIVGVMVNNSGTLGIIPTGTRNNVAFNLGIPNTVADAVKLLREGRSQKVDVGTITSAGTTHWFLEAAALGLLTDLYPAADNLQHGDLGQIGTLLSTFVSSTPSNLTVILDGQPPLETIAYIVLIANMTFIGPHFQISSEVSYDDGHLDVFVFSDMTKFDLISYILQAGGGVIADSRINHHRVKQVTIHTDPQMPVLADGTLLEPGAVTVEVHPHALSVMGGLVDVPPVEKTSESEAIPSEGLSNGT